MQDKCKDCKYFNNPSERTGVGKCWKTPQEVIKRPDEFCGEFQQKVKKQKNK